MSEDKYFNFPIIMLKGFLLKPKVVLNNILDYAIYANFDKNIEYYQDDEEGINSSMEYFSVSGDAGIICQNGLEQYEAYRYAKVKVGIRSGMFWDYFKNSKTEFQLVCLLAHIAIRSILQNKSYCKIDNAFLFSRMAGFEKSLKGWDIEKIPDSLRKYMIPYRVRKIKSELVNDWKLKTYSRYTRGFYVSYKMSLEDLIYQAEKRRKSTKEKQQKKAQNDALKKVMKRIENDNKNDNL
ncbi:hypothetical protein GCM10011344_32630 [Dokdonia pacifica]|uniref:Uncharacterized protein n=1 Tax=Dokdonia pacifica TaxID=1627892 RepID=A0A239BKU8_9FLAO|nr:hypothetical protein [Dokdonia pacifica]GGG29257.1 hypothetical protein GCM10011344_32630 [Dokdonia pacifica]SNS07673.1 hypothetical protein SAMN06265376_106200 [Dokdonia pacifica]